jgi:hypothetical protein
MTPIILTFCKNTIFFCNSENTFMKQERIRSGDMWLEQGGGYEEIYFAKSQ